MFGFYFLLAVSPIVFGFYFLLDESPIVFGFYLLLNESPIVFGFYFLLDVSPIVLSALLLYQLVLNNFTLKGLGKEKEPNKHFIADKPMANL